MHVGHQKLLRAIFVLILSIGLYVSANAGICGDGCRAKNCSSDDCSDCGGCDGCGNCRSSESDNKSFINPLTALGAVVFTRPDGTLISQGDATADVYICPDNEITQGMPWRLGWSSECAVPKNGFKFDKNGNFNTNSNKSCVVGEDFWKTFLDEFLTLGISEYMIHQFCSAEVGNPGLEGAFINKSFLEKLCPDNNCTSQEKYKSLLRGYTVGPDGKPAIFKIDPGDVTTNICQGIPNIHKPAFADKGNSVSPFNNSDQKVYCPLTRCDIPTNDIKIKYFDPEGPRLGIMAAIAALVSAASGGTAFPIAALGMLVMGIISLATGDCCGIADLYDGNSANLAFMGIIKFTGTGGKADGDMICAKMSSVLDIKVACKLRPDQRDPSVIPPNCYLDNSSCVDDSLIKSQAVIPLTSRMMQCVTETLSAMFIGGCPNNPVVAFQNQMRTAIKWALVLYVIFFGLKIVMGGELPGKQELFMFVVKIGFVIWLSVGSSSSSSDTSKPGALSPNGLQWLYETSLSAMNSFALMIAKGADLNICNYADLDAPGEYPYPKGYSYLALWDMLDCRIGFYLGFLLPTEVGKAIIGSSIGGGLTAGIFELMLTAMVSFNLVLLLFVVLFGVMLLSVVVYLTHLFVIAMIAIAILVFVGPIFVPMLLFERTKQYFEGWIKLIMGYTLQPAVVAAFIVLMIAVFDSAMYGSYNTDSTNTECQFTRESVDVNGQTKPYWIMKDNQGTNCTDSLGYFLMTKLSGLGLSKKALFQDLQLIPIVGVVMGWAEVVKVIGALVLCAFFAFLFYYFGEQLSGFASELSGASNIGKQSVGANAVTDLVKAAVEIGLNAATDGAYGKVKEAASAAKDSADNASAKVEAAPGMAVGAARGAMTGGGGGGSGAGDGVTSSKGDKGIVAGGGGEAGKGIPSTK